MIPFVNVVAAWVVTQELAKKFGKSQNFGIGLFIFPVNVVCAAILAFGDAEYQGGGKSKKKKSKRDDDDDENW